MQCRGLLGAVSAIVFSLLVSASARGEGLPREFTSAYGAALQTIQRTYSQATVEGTIKQQSPQTGKSFQEQFVLRMVGTWLRLDTTIMNPPGANSPTGNTHVVLATPEASLSTNQSSSHKMFDFDSIKEDDYAQAKTGISQQIPLNYAYSFNNQDTILTMLQRSDVRITRFQRVKDKGERLYRIEYEQSLDPEGRQGPWKCLLLISPDEGYAMREFSRSTGSGSQQVTYSGSLKYSPDIDGVPLVDSIDLRQHHGSTLVERTVISISKFDTAAPKKGYFRADSM